MVAQATPPSLVDALRTPATDIQEQALLHRLSLGDREAFWELWERYRPDLLAQCCLEWMDGNYEDAEDALSSACLKALQTLPNHARAISNVRLWLRQLLYHHCLDIRRAQMRYRSVVGKTEKRLAQQGVPITETQQSPEEVILRQEIDASIRRSLADLPARLRTPSLLRFYEELPHQVIATQLNLTPATVRKRIQHARLRLQRDLQEYYVP